MQQKGGVQTLHTPGYTAVFTQEWAKIKWNKGSSLEALLFHNYFLAKEQKKSIWVHYGHKTKKFTHKTFFLEEKELNFG